jgi:carbon-monoxide dehydrogenase medium subunit
VATTLDDAVAALADRGRAGAPLAGATWIMRAPLRGGRQQDRSYVALSRIDELRRVEIGESDITIGACVTHAALASALADVAGCAALVQAAATSANPAVRQVATIGGNLCAGDFAAADLVPALICLAAKVELTSPGGVERISVERFLARRSELAPGTLLSRIVVARTACGSAHVRLPLRKSGDYPVAIVSLAVELDQDGTVLTARAAVGSVEVVARRWETLEAGLVGRPLDPQAAAALAGRCRDDFVARDGVEAAGWYRLEVLPSLVRRAAQALLPHS